MLGDDVDGPIALVNLHVTEEGCEYKHIPVEMTVPAAVAPRIAWQGCCIQVRRITALDISSQTWNFFVP